MLLVSDESVEERTAAVTDEGETDSVKLFFRTPIRCRRKAPLPSLPSFREGSRSSIDPVDLLGKMLVLVGSSGSAAVKEDDNGSDADKAMTSFSSSWAEAIGASSTSDE